VDGALVGARSLKPRKKKGNFIRHEIFFSFNQVMNILGRHEPYNTTLKECK
jgi:hypothetical protein